MVRCCHASVKTENPIPFGPVGAYTVLTTYTGGDMPNEASGETKRYTFRLPDAVLAKLDELVTAVTHEDGAANRTTVLIRSITQEHRRLCGGKKKPNKS